LSRRQAIIKTLTQASSIAWAGESIYPRRVSVGRKSDLTLTKANKVFAVRCAQMIDKADVDR